MLRHNNKLNWYRASPLTSDTIGLKSVLLQCTKPYQEPKCTRSEEHTSELQSRFDLVCRLLLEKKKKIPNTTHRTRAAHESYTRFAFAAPRPRACGGRLAADSASA